MHVLLHMLFDAVCADASSSQISSWLHVNGHMSSVIKQGTAAKSVPQPN